MAEKIGFIGLGIMGKPMAKNLINAGYDLTVYDIFPDPIEELVEAGATGAGSCAEVASATDVVITMVQDGPQAKQAILGEGGIIEGASEGDLVVDMSSIAPGRLPRTRCRTCRKERQLPRRTGFRRRTLRDIRRPGNHGRRRRRRF